MAAARPLTFAVLLRRHRSNAGLSQEELAARAGLSRSSISELERGLKRAPRKDTVARLADALALSQLERAAFEAAARGRPPNGGTLITRTGAADLALARGALPGRPAPPPLVGRERELAWLERHLAGGPPFLAVAGEPGIGKTRLLREGPSAPATAGWAVLQGGCQRRAGQEPYAPLLEARARYAAGLTPRQLRVIRAWLSDKTVDSG